MRRPEGYRLRDMTRIGKVSVAVSGLGMAFLIIGSAFTDLGAWRWVAVPVIAGIVIGLVSEDRRLAREGLPFMWR